jgi:CubicO group peptidase (beta-lactamase class C family)
MAPGLGPARAAGRINGVASRPRSAAVVLLVTLALTAPAGAQPAPAVRLDEAVAAAASLPRLHSLLVSHRGTLVVERYWRGARADRPANVKSVSKSVIAALVGLAIDRGLLRGVDQPIGPFFPGALAGPANAAKRAITIEDLLTMRSGLESTSSRNYGRWVTSADWVRFALRRPLVGTPGQTMDYSTGNSHLLSAILTQVSKTDTRRFANEALFGPLGFAVPPWPRDPQGIYFGGNDMLLTPRQMIAFGELYLNRGRAGARQVLPAAWVDATLVPRGRSHWSGQEYGYGWWLRPLAGVPSFHAWGFGGQYIVVVPELALVVAATSATTADAERREHRQSVFDVIERLVVRPVATAASGEGAAR